MYGAPSAEAERGLPGAVRAAGIICLGWALVRFAWTGFNCFVQTGPGAFFKGVFYYSQADGTANMDSTSLSFGVLFALAGVLLLRGKVWARGFALALAVVDGYGRLRSATGALFDDKQVSWFTEQAEGQLRLATMIVGIAVLVVLLVLLRSHLTAPATAAAGEPQRAAWSPVAPQPTFGYGYPYPQPQQAWQPAPQPAGYPYPGPPQQGGYPPYQAPVQAPQPVPPVHAPQPVPPVQAQPQPPVQPQPQPADQGGGSTVVDLPRPAADGADAPEPAPQSVPPQAPAVESAPQ